MSILETARKMAAIALPNIEVAVTQKGLIKQIDLITKQMRELRREKSTSPDKGAVEKRLKALHKRKVELEDMLESNMHEAASVEETAADTISKKEKAEIDKIAKVGVLVTRRDITARRDKLIAILKDKTISKQLRKYVEAALDDLDDVLDEIEEQEKEDRQSYTDDDGEEASVEETAAPLSKEKYDWYKYVGPRGMKITNSRGNRTVTLKNGSMFGVRSATSKSGKARLVTEELGPTIVFTFEQDEVTKITNKGVRIPVKVTFKRSATAPASVKRAVKAARQELTKGPTRKSAGGSGVNDEHIIKEAITTYASIIGQLDGAKLSKETVVYLKWASKQAAKIAKKANDLNTPVALLDSFSTKKAPKLKTKKVDTGNGNIRVAEAMAKFIPAVGKRWKKYIGKSHTTGESASDVWEAVSVMLSDLADYTKLYVALQGGNSKSIAAASYFDTNIREQLPKSVWNWMGKNSGGSLGY